MLSYRYVIKVLSQNKRNVLVRCRCLSTSSPNFNEKILFQFSNSRSIKLSTGKLARMADGCAVVASGDTNVMATVVSKNKQSVGAGFVPLTVEYRQKAAAAGRIPTHHLRREIGSTEKEILTSRIIDRSIRPLFPKNFTCETQVTCNLLSLDSQNDPDVLAINAASTALALSDVPWNGPIGAVCVALDSNYECITNPTRKERTEAKLNVIIAANETGNIYMMEAFANEPIHEQHLIKCVSKAIRETKIINQSIIKLQKNHGKPKRSLESIAKPEEKHLEAIRMLAKARIQNVFADHSHDKFSRDRVLQEIRVDTLTSLNEEFPGESTILNDAFTIIVKRIYAEYVTETGSRCDGRKIDELRPISCEVDLFRPVHGSALFQRGQTQVLCTATLDSLDSTWRADSISAITQGIREKNFMLHYEFPQYAVNEIGKSSIGRRDIGHGALAERALRPVVPVDNNFTIRLLCEVLESNGSSSMASVSAGSLALYDSGIKISSPVTGIAIGLIEYNDTNILLTDISGFEDFYGEMDFKIAGTKKAFTALQVKI